MSKTFHHQYLPNYLRTHRKRAGLSQEDIGFLLGIGTGAPVSRYERYMRTPTLAVILALEIIFEIPAQQIFSGVREDIKEQLARRAVLLHGRTLRKGKAASAQKLRLLERIGRWKER